MELKFGLATPSNLWSLDWDERRAVVGNIVESGFDHICRFVSIRPQSRGDDQYLSPTATASTAGG